jgi:hypothetical protein
MQDIDRTNSPYLSLIGFARNDQYIPNRIQVQNFCLKILVDQLEHFKIPSEILIVEWNYLPKEPPLSKVIEVKTEARYAHLKVIRVPPIHHEKYRYSQFKPFHVGAAINVGIRRAKGKFILPIASDVVFTEECLRWIGEKKLDENAFYRCNRHDVFPSIFENVKTDDRISFFKECESRIAKSHFPLSPEESVDVPNLHTNGCGDFCLAAKEKLMQVRGFKEGNDAGALDIDGLVIHSLNAIGIQEKILDDCCRVYKFFHKNSTSRALTFEWKQWQIWLEKITFRLGCAFYVRSFLNFPKRKFEYAKGALFDSRERNYLRQVVRWRKKIPPFYLNKEDWGLVSENLEENVLF